MKKRLLALLMAGLLTFMMVGCGAKDTVSDDAVSEDVVSEEVVEDEVVEVEVVEDEVVEDEVVDGDAAAAAEVIIATMTGGVWSDEDNGVYGFETDETTLYLFAPDGTEFVGTYNLVYDDESGALFLTMLGSCSFKITTTKETITESTKEYEINIEETFLDTKKLDNYRLIEPLNNRMEQIADSLIYDIKSQSISFFSTYVNAQKNKKKSVAPSYKYQLTTKDTAFIATKKIISTRIMAYSFSGGAHGMTKFYGMNYSPKLGSFLQVGDILDLSKSAIINAAIARNFKNEDGCFSVVPTIDLATTVNISEESIIFTYEHYILGAYSCGYSIIEVPIEEIEDCVLI